MTYDGQNGENLWNFAKNNKLIGLDNPDIVTSNWNHYRSKFKGLLSGIWVNQFEMFCNEMEEDDIVVVLKGWYSLLGIAKITKKEYRYDKKLSGKDGVFFDHVREVEWKRKYNYDHPLILPKPLQGFNNTLSRVEMNTKRWPILMNLIIK